MGTRLPLVDLPGGTHQETAVKRKVTADSSSDSTMAGPPAKKPAELTVSTNPPQSVSPPLISPFNQKPRMALTGFLLFVRKERNSISERYPTATNEQLTTIYKSHWNSLDVALQATLNAQARELNLHLGNVSPHSPPDVIKENEEELTKIIQVAHAAPQRTAAAPAVPPAAAALHRDTVERLQTVASSLGLKRKMTSTVERGVLGGQTVGSSSTFAARGSRPSQQPAAASAATASNGMTAAAALEFYYRSLCQPAFPEAGEPPLTPAPPQYYLDQWQMLEFQRREAALARL
ncbi:hypothetical protein PFISCL1PPCAC_8601 [Pristionchus fissidentatus]|uniref:HMG box domain-containing protein n=1 Tax=Pristionchus fissidentatus TaxID=1538716 RepID=A0AAV5VHI3_9BILA|nr:hypothetical protein PFISCL1PPCAC_8601 [Pristionchus fissidentatus]